MPFYLLSMILNVGVNAMNKPRLTKLRLSMEIRGLRFSNACRWFQNPNWPAADRRVTAQIGVMVDDRGKESAIFWTAEGSRRNPPRTVAGWHDSCRVVAATNGKHYVVCWDNFGRAVVYRANCKPECVVYDTPGFMFNQIKRLCDERTTT